MKRKIIVGLVLGVIAGGIDLIPMVVQQLPLNADLSAFSLWIVVGILTAMITAKIPGALKGIIVSFMVLLPCSFIIGWNEPMSLLPIAGMTVILGSFVDLLIEKLG